MAVNLNKLKTQLQMTGLLQSNPPLFQLISQLIEFVRQFEGATTTTATSTGGSVTALLLKTYLTSTDETGTLVNSRELLAGTNVSFDDTVAGERTINVAGGSGSGEWSVLTNGDEINPELIYASGDVIMTEVP